MENYVESFFEFPEEVICHLQKAVYVGCDDDTLEDILYVLEQVLQCYILVAVKVDMLFDHLSEWIPDQGTGRYVISPLCLQVR